MALCAFISLSLDGAGTSGNSSRVVFLYLSVFTSAPSFISTLVLPKHRSSSILLQVQLSLIDFTLVSPLGLLSLAQ
ncbi:hypothetical protein R3P38DRAFT_2902375 [Favolaschia claudopus]|uniref:Uncharacterized protein n=1 Tax=Favolaschia claudopus TaxID=2862362 RepID=A0AAW0CNK2_9AGAR